MKIVNALFCLFGVVGTASAKGPDLNGVWTIMNPDQKSVFNYFHATQTGNEVKMSLVRDGKPEVIVYDLTFQSDGLITGRSLSADQVWRPAKFIVTDANHLKLEGFPAPFVRGNSRDAAWVTETRKLQGPLPAKPFSLAGTWKFSRSANRPISVIRQEGDSFTFSFPQVGKVFFKGRYTKNPTIDGEGYVARPGGTLEWTKRQITVFDPDHISLDGDDKMERWTKPTPNDIPCDAGNPYHVKEHFAWVRECRRKQQTTPKPQNAGPP